MTLFLVRHGRPLVDPGRPAHTWELDPAGFDDVWALRERLPRRAAWFCSPEPKATQTAQLLTDTDVGVVEDLRDLVRDTSDWIEDYDAALQRAFDHPEQSAYDGWETLADCRRRVWAAVAPVLAVHGGPGAAGGGDVVLVGHGTAWTVLAAELDGVRPTVQAWAGLTMPDVLVRPIL